MIYLFDYAGSLELSQVGGKGKALVETYNAGFPVPEGLVLSVDFFKTWLDAIKSSEEWQAVLTDPTVEACDAVKKKAEELEFNPNMTADFRDKFDYVSTNDLFAVRSSSPEEDLESASFAGMYETIIGVTRDKLESSIAKAFSSCFDYRVMAYKVQHNLGLDGTSIAVIVQKQIASDVSGVGFSLNPLNNCYDEVVINASFGLGEAIVSGILTPDTYTYDFAQKKITEKNVNKKDIALWLKADGGVEEKENTNKEEQALPDEQIVELSDLIKKCEEYYGMPMDIEWAYENGKLYLLQSRPITTYIPFFEELLTKPGEKKKFYLDLMIMTQGFEEPMSVLGLEIWADMLDKVKMGIMSPQINGSSPALHGRQYISITAFQKLLGKKGAGKLVAGFDDIDLELHVPDNKPDGTKHYKRKLFKAMVKMLPGASKALFANHDSVVREYNETAERSIEKAKALNKEDDFKYNASQVSELLLAVMSTIAILYVGMFSQVSVKKIFKGEDIEKDVIALAMDLEGNPTSAMGHLLFKMACYDELKQTSSREEFVNKCEGRSYSDIFMKDYDEFMDKYSVRDMKEIDVASKRIYEDIGLLYDKLKEINTEDNQIAKVKEKRKEAYDKLLQAAKEKGKEKKFIKAAEKYQATFGYREHPKYLVVYVVAMLHDICLEMAREWVNEGRLEELYQIFDLHIDEISRAQKDPDFDMVAARERNLEGYRKVANVTNWPLVIDSRGKIYKPKMEIKAGDIVGDPIAPGKAIGKAKILRSPYEKPLNQGEILIARATEPSWTPIFINAAGVVMEIGGPLQHGGIIAREYGIPCVSGLIGIMDIIKDGDLLEVDGTNGIVRIIESADSDVV